MPNEPLQVSKCPQCGATHEGGRFCSVCGTVIPALAPAPITIEQELEKVRSQLAAAEEREQSLKRQLAVLEKLIVHTSGPEVQPGQDADSRIEELKERARKFEAAFQAKSQEAEELAKELAILKKAGGVKGWLTKTVAGVLIAGSSLGGGYKWGQHNPSAGSPEVKNQATKSASTAVKHAPAPEPTVAVKNESHAANKSKPATAKAVVHATPAPKMQTFTLDVETKRDDTVVSVGDGKISSDDKKTKFTPNGPVPTGQYRVESTNTNTRGPKVQIENPAKANGWLTKLIIHGKGKLTVTMEWKPI
jgi:hypothetical protein